MPDEPSPTEHAAAPESETPTNGASSKPALPPAVALAFVIIALLGMLIVLILRGNLTGSGETKTSPEITVLQAEANALRDQLNRERMSLGLRPLEGNSESVEDVAARLKKDADVMVALSKSLHALIAEKEAELSAKSAELIRSEQLRQSLATEASRLQGELQRALVEGSDNGRLRSEMENLKAQRDALSAELAATKEQLTAAESSVSQEDFADLQRRLEETTRAKEFFEARVAALEGEAANAKLFAKSEDELLPAAVELFRSLRTLENQPDSDITLAYSNLGASLGASVLQTLNFATGSSALTPEDEEKIRDLVPEIPDGDMVLAIGYASETGNVDKNQTLSSDRATAAAQLISSLKRPGQKVQAVYLGQTDRFSSRIPERNQLVEIWHIRQK